MQRWGRFSRTIASSPSVRFSCAPTSRSPGRRLGRVQCDFDPGLNGPLRAAAEWAVSAAGEPARGHLAEVFEQRAYELWLETVVDEARVLAEFDGDEHADLTEKFRELDRLWIKADS